MPADARKPRPLWRWWMFCAALHFYGYGKRRDRLIGPVLSWSVLPSWLGCCDGSGCEEPLGCHMCRPPIVGLEVPF